MSTANAPLSIELKQPRTAALLAWLVPGLGHLYQGRTFKGVLFMACIVPMFGFGFYAGGGHVAYASPLPVAPNPAPFVLDRWPFVCQAGIGVVAIPAIFERLRYRSGEDPSLGGAFYPPRTGAAAARGARIVSTDGAGNEVIHPDELAKWHYDHGYYFELGTVYTVIAGLLNLLVVYDAHAGPLVVAEKQKKKKRAKDGGDPEADEASVDAASADGAPADDASPRSSPR
ncbi:MAG: DUF6677 family protein [Planctomycetota bacterium]